MSTAVFLEDISLCHRIKKTIIHEGWNFNSGNYLFTTDTK